MGINYTGRYQQGREKLRIKRLTMDKARLPATKVGKVPLTHGKYGMTVEEYLEWCRARSKRQDKLPVAKKTEEHNED